MRWMYCACLTIGGMMAAVLASGCSDVTDSPRVVSVVVEAPAGEMRAGETLQLSAEVLGEAGEPIADRSVTWTSSLPEVATISGTGLISAATDLAEVVTVTFTASVDGVEDSVAVIIVPDKVADFRFELPWELGARVVVWVDQQVQVTAVPVDALGAPLPDRAVQWSSADPDIATVDQSGVVQGVRFPGSTLALVESEGVNSSMDVIVGSAREECLIPYGTIGVPDTVSGNLLSASECRRSDPGQFAEPPAHPWHLTLENPGEVHIWMESDGDAFLILTDSEYRLIAEDDDSGGGPGGRDAMIKEPLPAGDYIIWATSYSARERPVKFGPVTGSYTLHTHR